MRFPSPQKAQKLDILVMIQRYQYCIGVTNLSKTKWNMKIPLEKPKFPRGSVILAIESIRSIKMRLMTINVLIISFILSLIPIQQQQDIPPQRCFSDIPSISNCIESSFVDYWELNGELPVFGYPITEASHQEQLDSDQAVFTQWFERGRLEIHPDNPEPYTILMGRLGADRLRQLGWDPALEPRDTSPIEGCLWFEETGFNVCNQTNNLGFKQYWENHGLNIPDLDPYQQSLQLFGLPITAARYETNASGHYVLTQWFERARFEWHPSQPDEYKVLLGLLGNEIIGKTTNQSTIGIEVNIPADLATMSQVGNQLGASWVRYHNLKWRDIETIQGQRDWSKMSEMEEDFLQFAQHNLSPIVIVSHSPDWAQQIPGSACGPIKSSAFNDFASFMAELASKYSKAPYNIHHWEIGNEPDIAASSIDGDSVFGCWGNEDDPYYGGGYYAEMLKVVYPAVKQADPQAQIVFGGLLLDCDPALPPSDKDCKPSKFLEGALRNGGGSYFDIISYHAYAYSSSIERDWDLNNASWGHRGGAVLGKLSFLRETMQQYNVVKPVLLTETSLLCYDTCNFQTFYPAQANYAVRLFTRAQAHGIIGTIWYTLNGPGWRQTGLLDNTGQPRPAYYAIQQLASKLNGAVYANSTKQGALESYTFLKGSTFYQIMWTNDGSTVNMNLPSDTIAISNHFGEVQQITPSGISVGHNPIIIERKAYQLFLQNVRTSN
jgi:hypothetical protein